jgi:hypothetical protein
MDMLPEIQLPAVLQPTNAPQNKELNTGIKMMTVEPVHVVAQASIFREPSSRTVMDVPHGATLLDCVLEAGMGELRDGDRALAWQGRRHHRRQRDFAGNSGTPFGREPEGWSTSS